jgi:hypothetical protein
VPQCTQEAEKWCAYCGVAGYCSFTCQKDDWTLVHRHGECSFFAREIRPLKKITLVFEMQQVLIALGLTEALDMCKEGAAQFVIEVIGQYL